MRYHDVLKKIKPGRMEEQELKRIASSVIHSIRIPHTKLAMGGSAAKGTWLKGAHDIDIYVKFDPEHYKGVDIAQVLKDVLSKRKCRLLHGSRDYCQMDVEGYTVELIPIMEIERVEDAQNITDISPFHAKWVHKHKKYTDEIRLAKAFAKANGFYGAESYIKGFSGYSLEVLTIHYGGFDKMMRSVAKWRARTVIDTEQHHKRRVVLNDAKMLSPLVLVDPVQATRNVTAVLSKEKYQLFVKTARAYLTKPSETFFVKEAFSVAQLLARHKERIVALTVEPLDGKKDVVGAKILKVFEYLRGELEKHEFTVKDAGWYWSDAALLWFVVSSGRLSEKVVHYGPPVREKERLEHFKQKWGAANVKMENGRAVVHRDREYREPEELLFDRVMDAYVATKVQRVVEQKVYK